jgi:MoxR-like ATPase
VTIIERTTGVSIPEVSKVADGAEVIRMGLLALETPVATHINRYVAQLVVSTHPENPAATQLVRQYVQYGSSPRGAQALIIGAKINALLEGRFNVAFEDIDAVAPESLRHRLLLNFEGMAEGIRTDDIIADLLEVVRRVQV